jgi:hypothetical protein
VGAAELAEGGAGVDLVPALSGGISTTRKMVPDGVGSCRIGRSDRSFEPSLLTGISSVTQTSVTPAPGQPLSGVALGA